MKLAFESERLDAHLKSIFGNRPITHFSLEGIDRLLGGVRPWLTILSGEPGTGKTSLMLQLADDIAAQGLPVLFISLEMAPPQLIAKSLSRMSNGILAVDDLIRASDADDPSGSCVLKAAIARYASTIAGHLAFMTSLESVLQIGVLISECEKQVGAKPVVFFDYVQAMPSAQSAEERMAIKTTISELRQIVNAYQVPVYAISSINRANYQKPVSGLDCLGGSSAVEYSSDCVAFLSVEGKGEERRRNMQLAERPLVLTILKNRYGTCGEMRLAFDTEHASFEERE